MIFVFLFRWLFRHPRDHHRRQDLHRLRRWVVLNWAAREEQTPDLHCWVRSRREQNWRRPPRWTRVGQRCLARCAEEMEEQVSELSEPSTTTPAPAITTTAAVAAMALAMEPPNWEACSKASRKCQNWSPWTAFAVGLLRFVYRLISLLNRFPFSAHTATPSAGSAATTTSKSTTNSSAQQRSNSPPAATSASNASNGPMDFNTELTKHLTLKRQKQQQQQQPQPPTNNTHINATEANLRTNRGPPPQPPKVRTGPMARKMDEVL